VAALACVLCASWPARQRSWKPAMRADWSAAFTRLLWPGWFLSRGSGRGHCAVPNASPPPACRTRGLIARRAQSVIAASALAIICSSAKACGRVSNCPGLASATPAAEPAPVSGECAPAIRAENGHPPPLLCCLPETMCRWTPFRAKRLPASDRISRSSLQGCSPPAPPARRATEPVGR